LKFIDFAQWSKLHWAKLINLNLDRVYVTSFFISKTADKRISFYSKRLQSKSKTITAIGAIPTQTVVCLKKEGVRLLISVN